MNRTNEQIRSDIDRCKRMGIEHQMWLTNHEIGSLEKVFYVAKVRGKPPLRHPSGDEKKFKYLCRLDLLNGHST